MCCRCESAVLQLRQTISPLMSQITIKLSDKADALIAQLQKEIFNRRRKKVSPAGVVETLVESGAKSQSDKRFATSWKNLIADIEKAAKVADAHGAKPANLSDAEWAMVLSHRSRAPRAKAAPKAKAVAKAKPAAQSSVAPKAKAAPRAKAAPKAKPAAKFKPAAKVKPAVKVKPAAKAKPVTKAKPAAKVSKAASPITTARKPARKTAPTTAVSTKRAGSSVARRMAKAVGRLGSTAAAGSAAAAPSSNGLQLSAVSAL